MPITNLNSWISAVCDMYIIALASCNFEAHQKNLYFTFWHYFQDSGYICRPILYFIINFSIGTVNFRRTTKIFVRNTYQVSLVLYCILFICKYCNRKFCAQINSLAASRWCCFFYFKLRIKLFLKWFPLQYLRIMIERFEWSARRHGRDWHLHWGFAAWGRTKCSDISRIYWHIDYSAPQAPSFTHHSLSAWMACSAFFAKLYCSSRNMSESSWDF